MNSANGSEWSNTLHGVQVNQIKIYDDSDFLNSKHLCVENHDWNQVYRKKCTIVWTRKAINSQFEMIKARTEYEFSADLLYDVLQDSQFRSKWDHYCIANIDIGLLNPNHDISYYSMGAIPFKSRDFVLQRAYIDFGSEMLICAHSVCHSDYPATNTNIRGIVYLTVYYIRVLSKDTCQLTYVTHSDPKGKLPSWLINKITKVVAPQIFKKLHKACKEYPKWKQQHSPNYKPWKYPEQQIDMPRVNAAEKCKPINYQQEIVDEANTVED